MITLNNYFWGSRFMKSKLKFNKNVILKLILVGVVLYFIFLLVSLFVKIRDKKQEIDNINNQILSQKNEFDSNTEILEKNNSNEDESQPDDESQKNTRIYENVVK